jgi:hypothetical protein
MYLALKNINFTAVWSFKGMSRFRYLLCDLAYIGLHVETYSDTFSVRAKKYKSLKRRIFFGVSVCSKNLAAFNVAKS